MDPELDRILYARALSGAAPQPGAAAKALGNVVAPGITNYLTTNQPPPATVPNAAGKLPSSDPREAPALYDLATMGAIGATGGVGGETLPLIERINQAAAKTAGNVNPLDAMIMGAAPTAIGQTSPADAASLKASQQRQLEMERQQSQIEQEKAAQDAQLKQQQAEAASKLQLQTQQQQFEQAQAQKAAEAKAQHDAMLAAQNAPFREKYPGLTASLPLIGAGIAGGVPYLSRFKSVLQNNRLANMAEEAVERSRGVMEGVPNKAQLAGVQQEMATALKGRPQDTHAPMGASVASALAGADIASMTPQEYDATMLPPGDPNREIARQTLTDPMQWISRMGPAAAGAGAIAKLGSHVPVAWPEHPMPEAAMRGIMKQAQQQKSLMSRALKGGAP